LSQKGVEILEQSGILEVDYREKTPRGELLNIIENYEGLIVRSASKVDKEVIEKAKNLKVVIRAGVGVDNIDIPACSQKGIVVMNAPAGNSISTAEQAIALMFALARKTPQANASMKQKKWEKKKFSGRQLTGKTLGVIGLGRIGREVVKRGKGLKMKVIGYDPYIPAEKLEHLEIEIGDLDTLLKESDIITVHTPLTDSTRGLINKANLHALKKGVLLVNAARGGIYDEEALAEGLKSGHLGGVGLDVYSTEPPPEDFPLYEFDNCIMTPHLGASTKEAQEEVAKETAESMVAFFKEGVARNSLNFPTLDPKEMDILSPWFDLSVRLGMFAAQVVSDPITRATLFLSGEITQLKLSPLEIALSRGLLSVAIGEEVNFVNAPILAKERGIEISVKKEEVASPMGNVMRAIFDYQGGSLELRATVNFSGGTILAIDKMPAEFKPEGDILVIRNKDVPKVVGDLGMILGEAGINIASLQLSRKEKGKEAITVIEVDSEPSKEIIEEIQKKDYILDVKKVQIRY
ncbi:MAG: phosphoglycerate dehydrogenase, partial [Candidatus Hydrogenedentota bacterium]